jgi:hypothetical protein
VFEPRAAAARCGIAVEFADLGDWGQSTLIAEYDPCVPAIRINPRAIERYRRARPALTRGDVRALVDLTIAHELYHHWETTGEVARLATRAQREAAADAFARSSVVVDAALDAFLKAVS